jgi:hypothetical protein
MFYKKATINTVDGARISSFEDTLTSADHVTEFLLIYQEYVNSAISYTVNYNSADSMIIEAVWANKSDYEENYLKSDAKQIEMFNKSVNQYYSNPDKFILNIETTDNI